MIAIFGPGWRTISVCANVCPRVYKRLIVINILRTALPAIPLRPRGNIGGIFYLVFYHDVTNST